MFGAILGIQHLETHEQYSVRDIVHCEFRNCDIDDLDGVGKLEIHNAQDSHPILPY